MTRPVRSWEEQDAYTGWRRYLRWRPGELAGVKRRTHKRERREALAEIVTQTAAVLESDGSEKECPLHGRTLAYVDPQPDDGHPSCLLECTFGDCGYEARE